MVRIGDEFANAASGERYVFRQTGAETEGALVVEDALLMREFGDEIRPARPPLPVQRILFPILAIMGRVLGYRLAPS